jgi:hypothetical protein
VLPIIAPSLVDLGLFGFTLSWDEVARSSQAFGSDQNTLEGVAAAVMLIESLARLGLRTSKQGGYAEPLAKAIAGFPIAPPR